ncbi:MAG: ExbD/TolR family protein [Hyphomicrobiaceae bacterium]|nr:ExbD/TolR family protein [Hyphomicrobiaceae bacterium]
MGASIKAQHQNTGRRRRARRHAPLAEINVTPFVDVMLVLLIIFMVAAPLLQVGVPLELPQSKGPQLKASVEPLAISVSNSGDIFISETKVTVEEIEAKLKAIAGNGPEGFDRTIYVRGDNGVPYGAVARVMGRISAAGFKKISLVTDQEGGG